MKATPPSSLVVLLNSAGIAAPVLCCDAGEVIFSAGDAADSIMDVLRGTVRLSVASKKGRETVVSIVQAGEFFGEACLAGRPQRERTAIAMSRTAVVVIDRTDMAEVLRTEAALRDRFIEYVLRRNLRAEADLLDQLVSSCEQRLARALLLLARYGKRCTRPKKVLPMMSRAALAGMVGSTRSRVNYLMNRFERLGLIETAGGLTVKRSLRRVCQESTHAR